MMLNNYSQLPVMQSERTVDGFISWQSIGEAFALNRECHYVRDCMRRDPVILDEEESLLQAVSKIAEVDFVVDFVLVRSKDQRIVGLVTTSDITLHFRELAEPFLLLGQIESSLRYIIESHFDSEEIAAAKDPTDEERSVQSAADLTFGEYRKLLENKQNWERFGKYQIDRSVLREYLERVRNIRNNIMHFNPDGIPEDEITQLQRAAFFLERFAGVV